MRVVPAPGQVLRDYRTRRFVDPDLGVEVPETDLTFAWLLDHGDCAALSDADYQAALAQREVDKAALAPPADTPAADPAPAATPKKPAAAPPAQTPAQPEGDAQ